MTLVQQTNTMCSCYIDITSFLSSYKTGLIQILDAQFTILNMKEQAILQHLYSFQTYQHQLLQFELVFFD